MESRVEEIKRYLIPVVEASLVIAIVILVIMIVYPPLLGGLVGILSIIIFLPIIILIALFQIIKSYFPKYNSRQFILTLVFSFAFIMLPLKTYRLISYSSLGAKVLTPKTHRRVKEHFEKTYGREFVVTGVTYSFNLGDATSGSSWSKIAKGKFVDTGESVGAYFHRGIIIESYGRSVFSRKVKKYYEDLLGEIIPWEFRLSLRVNGAYSWHHAKSYEEVLESKDKDIVSWLNFIILCPEEVLGKYGKQEVKEMFFNVVKVVYNEVNYMEEESSIQMTIKEVSSNELELLNVDQLLDKVSLLRLYIRTSFLNQNIEISNSYKDLEESLKKIDRKIEY